MVAYLFLFFSFLLSNASCEKTQGKEAQDGQLPPLKQFSCKAKIYENTMHQGDFIYSWKKVPNINDCIGYCSQYEGALPCRAINYFTNLQSCDLLSGASTDVKAEPTPPNLMWINVRHVVITGCDVEGAESSTPTPQPVIQLGECGKQVIQPKINSLTYRIVNGDEAIPHSWPWVVSIKYYGKHVCGGTLIPVAPGLEETDLVLTAAHCVKDEILGLLNITNLRVITGASSLKNEDGQEVAVESVRWHDFFMSDGLMNDIALIKLMAPVKFSSTVSPICLPKYREAIDPGTLCIAAGWGRVTAADDKVPQRSPDKLQQLQAPIIKYTTCQDPTVWGDHFNPTTMLCAGSLNGHKNICLGDSGGALMCRGGDRWLQYGIASFVYRQNCIAEKKPGVYTKVSLYRLWIDDMIKKRSSVYKKYKTQ